MVFTPLPRGYLMNALQLVRGQRKPPVTERGDRGVLIARGDQIGVL